MKHIRRQVSRKQSQLIASCDGVLYRNRSMNCVDLTHFWHEFPVGQAESYSVMLRPNRSQCSNIAKRIDRKADWPYTKHQ